MKVEATKLPNLLTNGFVKTSGSDGTLGVDTSTYLTSVGTGVANEITYWSGTNALGSLATATYPSLTELSYVKGVTSAIQTQLNGKAPSLGADDNYVTDAEKIVIGNTSGTNTGDNAINTLYSGLVTNATHTGDATGSGALTVVALNGTNLAALATGVLKNTTTTGVPFISKVVLTEPATAATLTIANNQTLTVNGSATITNGTHSGTNTGDNTVCTSGTATTAVTLATPRTINGVSFDGSANIAIPPITWAATTVNATMVINNGYLANKGTLLTLTLPTTAAVGSVIRVAGMNAGLWQIAQNASEYIRFGNQVTTTGVTGYLASVNAYDAVELVCIVADTGWLVVSSVGNITVN